MKYFIDTEFKEKPNTIDLISIGIVSEDGREYYALNSEMNLKEIWKDEWLNDNVLTNIYCDFISGDMRNHLPFSKRAIRYILNVYGKTKKEIAEQVKIFCHPGNSKLEFYGYYADYDWVVFCWLFGRMIDLPKGFPMYCKDLKQMMDDKGLDRTWKSENCPEHALLHNAISDARWNLRLYKKITNENSIHSTSHFRRP